MGFLQGTTTLLHYGSENNWNSGPIHSIDMAMSKLVITHKLEEKMVEAPLVRNLSIAE
ncbi:hypothetical protein Lalb_Chr18g0050091 [Lupinus albus]|uniref:Uncharacterized protein n=2 Tax=Lupinus albus TaxID=3870 RepID=A0A6A4NXK5_LUPAL|nr:hypothetical protein Lalb_Chr18g0050091 [Lupinus albus]